MNTVTATRRTIRREWTWFGTLLVISVGMMGVSDAGPVQQLQSGVNIAMAPIETTMNDVADTVESYWSALLQLDHLRTQNEQLQRQNQQLQEELQRMAAISQLNTDWTAITAAQQALPYQTTPARVIVRNLSDVTERTVIINKGSHDGLIVGECVVDAGNALVGRISKVGATVSEVLLISDPNAIVVGEEAKSGATGTIRGSIAGELQMEYVDVADALTVGEAVVTAGEELPAPGANPTAGSSAGPNSGLTARSPYPPGLLIGTITAVKSDPNAVVQSATIKPAARLGSASFVLVILNYSGGFPSADPNATPFHPITPDPNATPTPTPGKATPTPKK
jgi:rod shape-determining protein MreC